MHFELSKEFLKAIEESIKNDRESDIIDMVIDLHPADIADIINHLSLEDAKLFYQYLDAEKAANALMELEEEKREDFLEVLTSDVIAKDFIDNLDSDDATDVIQELPVEKQAEVISKLEDPEHVQEIVDLLNYDEDTAGGLMAKELIRVEIGWSVEKCIKEIRKQAEDFENVYSVYVTDSDEKLIGKLSLKKLLLASDSAKIESLANMKISSVNVHESQEEVISLIKKYNLITLPVVDDHGRLVGRITIDDVMDVMEEEAEKDYQMASGISEKLEVSSRILNISRARLPWLLIGLLGGIAGAKVIGAYESQIQIYPEMAFFIPLIAAMGGNAGVQSSAIVVQAIASHTLRIERLAKKILKELTVSLLNGLVCSIIILGYNLAFSDSMSLSMTVSLALLTVIIVASLAGTLIPLFLDKYKIDPALATGPFITTLNDLFGLFIYFAIGRIVYGLF